jgi:hypothetical protein
LGPLRDCGVRTLPRVRPGRCSTNGGCAGDVPRTGAVGVKDGIGWVALVGGVSRMVGGWV